MTANLPTYNYLQFVRFKSLSLWDVKKNRIFDNKETSDYDFVRLADVLSQVKRVEFLQPTKDYKLLGVKSYGLGVFHRETKKGNDIKAKYLWELKEGDLVYSRLGASSGSFGLINKDFDNYFVSNEFPAFTIDSNRVLPQYLNLVLTSKRFYEKIADFNTGSALKRFHEDKFLNLEIPLPTKIEQESIIETYTDKEIKAVNLKRNIEKLELELKQYFLKSLGLTINENKANKFNSKIQFVRYKNIQKWSLSSLLKEKKYSFKEVKYKMLPLNKILVSFDGGKTPSTSRKDFWNGNINWVSPKDFNGISIESSIDKITDKAVKEAGMKIFDTGVLLGVFRSGILRHSFPIALTKIPVTINQDLKAIVVNENFVLQKYLLYFLHLMQDYVLENSVKYGVTVESINTDEFLNLNIIIPELKIQNEIINNIEDYNLKIEKYKYELAETENDKVLKLEAKIFNY